MNRRKNTQVAVETALIPNASRSRVRDRIIRTASDLFYCRGIRCVGVDAIASEAGTNKMSFYRSFASKDELVAEYLRGEERKSWQRWDEAVAAQPGDPRAQVEALFDVLVRQISRNDARGCALANAAVEISEPDHPARAVVERYKAEMRKRFRYLAREMRAREPDALGDSLTLLWEGSCLTRLTFPGRQGPVQGVTNAARALIAAHIN